MKMWRISHQREVLQHLMDVQRTSGKHHHIVPLLDSFEDDRETGIVFFVMPLLQRFDCPGFEMVSEVVQLFKQLLEASANIAFTTYPYANMQRGFRP